MGLAWHGEGDMVGATAFRPELFELTFQPGGREQLYINVWTSPEIHADPDLMRKEVHKMLDRLVDELLAKGAM